MNLLRDTVKDEARADLGQKIATRHGWAVATPGGFGRWLYCGGCHKATLPLTMTEDCYGERTRMAICVECGWGLTPPEPVA